MEEKTDQFLNKHFCGGSLPDILKGAEFEYEYMRDKFDCLCNIIDYKGMGFPGEEAYDRIKALRDSFIKFEKYNP